jgi:hypothetical protein
MVVFMESGPILSVTPIFPEKKPSILCSGFGNRRSLGQKNAGDLGEEGVPPRKPFRRVHPKDGRRIRFVGGRKIGKGKKEGRKNPPLAGVWVSAKRNDLKADLTWIVKQ